MALLLASPTFDILKARSSDAKVTESSSDGGVSESEKGGSKVALVECHTGGVTMISTADNSGSETPKEVGP